MLEYILCIGNYLNDGSARGGAYGFSIYDLKKLVTTKAVDNKTALLDHLIEVFHANDQAMLELSTDMASLQEACE